ncbi:glycosyltransferase [Flammeovirga sp. MY04]|uniref:glycosyltransferase n=1 Tax=Flammeovirga sp. MY04 TaxID=1191459 RepID=UPI0008063677|nr:glycosyltransferase [Flammeovirga sp. MY04]ANQ48430.1 glycosyltransferase [Flammeovirga sp. MY04]
MKVSVCMITYNHEKYIKEAIDGVLKQNCKHDFELVIGDDFSTDDTYNICLDYALKYPDKIRLLESKSNIGVMNNFIRTLNNCSGEYVALCEGDDFWLNPDKLNKQINYLDFNTNCQLSFHKVNAIKNNKLQKDTRFYGFKSIFKFEDLITDWNVNTCSIVFRNNFKFPEWIKDVYAGDKFIVYFNLMLGYAKYFNEPMAVYRDHSENITNTYQKKNIKKVIHNYLTHLDKFSKIYPQKNKSINKAKKISKISYLMGTNKSLKLKLEYFKLVNNKLNFIINKI